MAFETGAFNRSATSPYISAALVDVGGTLAGLGDSEKCIFGLFFNDLGSGGGPGGGRAKDFRAGGVQPV
ncbi:MAG: hypothetical protein Q8K65_03530 [Alphaproteobacteria bacterium]|nr:hypothetical protein [Alphaproteobacteria bacterium]